MLRGAEEKEMTVDVLHNDSSTVRTVLRMKPGDRILTAWADAPRGPGWSNYVIWAIVEEGGGKLRQECLQPHGQPREVMVLFDVAEAVHRSLLRALGEEPR